MEKQVVDVADLLNAIMNKDEKSTINWLCVARDGDDPNSNGVSHASDAVMGTLVRLFCGRFITKSVTHIEYFAGLVSAAYDNGVDTYRRWQRVANVCCYLIHNPRKEKTIHVYPGLSSPILELDDAAPEQLQAAASKSKLSKMYEQYVQSVLVSDADTIADYTRSWLLSEPVSPHTYASVLYLMEHYLMDKDSKNAYRICAYLITVCPELKTCNLKDVFEVLWKVVLLCIDGMDASPDVTRYVKSCRELFFRSLPSRKKARLCRIALLYYAIVVMCEGRPRPVYRDISITHSVLNLPVTMHESMTYLTLFPRLP